MNLHEEIQATLNTLNNGGLIIYPTDTILGLGCDATNPEAIEKIYALKERPKDKAMLILVDSDVKIERYVQEVPEVAWDIIDNVDSPTTIIYPNSKNLPENLISEDGSIAIRIVKDGFIHEVLKRFKKPIVSTSVNLSGQPSALEIKNVDDKILKAVGHVVNLPAQNKTGKSSSIIKIGLKGEVEIIRK